MELASSLDPIRKSNLTQNDAVRGKEGLETLCVWDCGSPLYDLHELVSVSFMIEKHFMVLPGEEASSKRFKAHMRGPVCSVAKAVTVVGSEIIDGCGGGGGGGGGCGWMVVKRWRVLLKGRGKCIKKVTSYKSKSKSFAKLMRF